VNPFSQIPELTDAERAVADTLPIGADPDEAARVLGRVPLWFHTFALNAAHGLYTPGVARDHRYRVPFFPASFAGQRVLDVGTFDGFYAFLAERRGAARVVAVDNEQYVAWVKARWGIELQGGEGFRAIAELLGSRVQYVRGDALALVEGAERFDVIVCFGILHRVENPLGLLRALGGLLAPAGGCSWRPTASPATASPPRPSSRCTRPVRSTAATTMSTGASAPAGCALSPRTRASHT
jgi:tRNA (mo5U34)-methyltransferase